MGEQPGQGEELEMLVVIGRYLDVATGGVWDSFVLLPRILGCWGSFARAFLPGRLVHVYY